MRRLLRRFEVESLVIACCVPLPGGAAVTGDTFLVGLRLRILEKKLVVVLGLLCCCSALLPFAAGEVPSVALLLRVLLIVVYSLSATVSTKHTHAARGQVEALGTSLLQQRGLWQPRETHIHKSNCDTPLHTI